jgi:hypothetical protein
MVEYVGENAVIGTIAAGAAGLAVGGVVGYVAGKRSSSKSSKAKRSKSSSRKKRNVSSRKKGRKLKFGSPAYRKKYLNKSRRRKQKQPHTAGKRKDTSHRRIRYTKNNQPYIIQSDGRARFISKRSVSSSKKRKGGKY